MAGFATLCLYGAILLSSFDLFLVIEVGFTLRATYLLLLPILPCALALAAMRKRLVVPLGFGLLLTWSACIVLFVPRSDLLTRGVAYAALLLFYVAVLFSTVQVLRNRRQLMGLARFYLWAFTLISLFGLAQFALPLLGARAPFVAQWWIEGSLARVNGFSFEPSYFATYLLPGWVLMAYLLQSKSRLVRSRPLLYGMFTVVSLAMLFSSSRMGIAMMALYFLYFPVHAVWALLRQKFSVRSTAYTLVGLFVGALLLLLVVQTDSQEMLLTGTGIAGTPSHSTDLRLRHLEDTLAVFAQSPLLGYSLGGIAPAIAAYRGEPINSLSEVGAHEGMSIFAEALAASGIIGFIPFILYMLRLATAPLRLSTVVRDEEIRDLLIGLTVAFIFQLVLLQLNQNILRPYFWLHVAILSAAYSVSLSSPKRTLAS